MNNDFATIEEAFGTVQLKGPEPPSLRGDVAQVHENRQKRMHKTIDTSHETALGYQGAPSCFGTPRELERCSAGTTHPVCPACARRHPCNDHAPSSSVFSTTPSSYWKSLSRDQKMSLLWTILQDILLADATLVVLFGIFAYLILRRK